MSLQQSISKILQRDELVLTVHRHGECHRGGDGETSQTCVQPSEGEYRSEERCDSAKGVEAQEQPPVHHPEAVPPICA